MADTPKKGALDLKKISEMWKAEGKPGKWLDYIKAHSDIRVSKETT